jgi:hypothetical protein
MKYRDLSKVHALIRGRFDKLYDSHAQVTGLTHARSWQEQLVKEWTLICSEIGISRVGNEPAKNDIIFEDPCGSMRWSVPIGTVFECGGWLEMSEETAQKILVLGMP